MVLCCEKLGTRNTAEQSTSDFPLRSNPPKHDCGAIKYS